MSGAQLESVIDTPAMREALAVVFDRTDGGEKDLTWDDVRDTLSSGQWGRLIGQGILVDDGRGFTIANPEDVRQGLEKEGSSPAASEQEQSEEIASESWTRYDKLAGLTAVVFFIGYWKPSVRDAIASVDNVVLAPITSALPFFSVILILAIVTGLYSILLQSRLMNKEKLQKYQQRMEDLKERREAAKEHGDDEALERIQEEQMEAAGDQLGMMKLQFRPMVWIMLLTIPVFLWLRWKVRGGHMGVAASGMVLPLVGSVGWQDAALGPMPAWIVWYFLCSMASRQIIQKTFDIQMSPAS